MSEFKPGDVVYRANCPMYMYLVLADGNNGIRLTSFQEHTYDGTAAGLKAVLEHHNSDPKNFYPNLSHRKIDNGLVLLTNISTVLVHLEIELQRLREEEEEYEKVPF